MEIADHEQFVCLRHYLFFSRKMKIHFFDSFVTTIAIRHLYPQRASLVNMNMLYTEIHINDSEHLLQKLTTLLAAI